MDIENKLAENLTQFIYEYGVIKCHKLLNIQQKISGEQFDQVNNCKKLFDQSYDILEDYIINADDLELQDEREISDQ